MAKLGELLLFDGPPELGAAFSLSEPAPETLAFDVGDATVGFRRGEPYVAAHLANKVVLDADSVLERGYSAAQRGLDLMSLRSAHMAVVGAALEHTLWWPAADGMRLRRMGSAPWSIDISATATVGISEVVPLDGSRERPFAPEYHAALRYRRMAYVTDDAYDAFRNLYLALEHLVAAHSAQGPEERERAWLERVLQEAAPVTDLGSMLPPMREADRAAWLVRRIYETRTRVFHAKPDRDSIIPHASLADEREVRACTRFLAYLIAGLLAHWHRVVGRRGEMSTGVLEAAGRATVDGLRILISDDATPLDAENGGLTHPRLSTAIPMVTTIREIDGVPGGWRVEGSLPCAAAARLEAVRRYDLVGPKGIMLTQTDDVTLSLEGVAVFEYAVEAFPIVSWLPRVLYEYRS